MTEDVSQAIFVVAVFLAGCGLELWLWRSGRMAKDAMDDSFSGATVYLFHSVTLILLFVAGIGVVTWAGPVLLREAFK